ncbi:hypothetical protein YC2023_011374 [Brassica napus]
MVFLGLFHVKDRSYIVFHDEEWGVHVHDDKQRAKMMTQKKRCGLQEEKAYLELQLKRLKFMIQNLMFSYGKLL